jgi:hypothetical protein
MAATYIEQPSKGQLRAGRPAGASACRVSIAQSSQPQWPSKAPTVPARFFGRSWTACWAAFSGLVLVWDMRS